MRLEVHLGAAESLRCRHQEDTGFAERIEAFVRHPSRLFGRGRALRKQWDECCSSIDDRHAAILLGTVGSSEIDVALTIAAIHTDAPRIAAHLAVLDERAAHVGLDVDLDLLSAVRTGDDEGVVHSGFFDSREVFVARPLAGARESHGDRPRWELHTP